MDYVSEGYSEAPHDVGHDGGASSPLAIRLEIDISDPECAAALVSHPAGRQRDEFARQALRIGVLALRQAQGAMDADIVRNEGDRLVREIAATFSRLQQASEQHLASTLRQYFDPENGRFTERVERLVKNDGELERMMRQQVIHAQETLSSTLTEHIGVQSPLLRLLSPSPENQLIAGLRSGVELAVQQRSDAILREFSLDNPEGALSRLLRELVDKHGKLTDSMAGRIDGVVEEFSLDSADSALSRLVRQVEQTQKNLSAEFSLDTKDSALARLRMELVGVLEKQDGMNRSFREEVLRTLDGMKIRKEEAARSTTHGRDFEAAGFGVVEKMCLRTGDMADFVGHSTGALGRSKVGDCLITLGPDCAAAGAKIVMEFKEDQTYSVKDSLAEIEQARKNRLADIGIFVHSRRTAPQNLQPLQRVGEDLIVVWDADDEANDIVLTSALSIAKAISVKSRAADALPVNPEEMDGAIRQIERQVARLQEIRVKSTTIRSGADAIIEIASKVEAEIASRLATLDTFLSKLRSGE